MAISTERQENIIKLLRERESISISELTETLYYSESSIRRDLRALEKLGLVILIRGEVALNRGNHFELPMMTRSNEHKQEKQLIAQYAATFIDNGDSVFLDSSTTVLEMLPFLSDRYDLTIVTNGMHTLTQAYHYIQGNFHCLGGTLRRTNGSSLTGPLTLSNLLNTHCDKMFFSVRAVDATFGLSDTSIEEAEVKRNMLKNTGKAFLLADSSKFNVHSIFQICEMSVPDRIITDSGFSIKQPGWAPYEDKIIIV